MLQFPEREKHCPPLTDQGELMKHHQKFLVATVVCILSLVLITTPAYAYIDPNAAGLVSQIITPLLIAAAAAATFLRRQIGAVFSALSRRLRQRPDVKEV
jgi:hypothetical protein